MIVRTSAKSMLMSPGTVIRSEMPCTPCRKTSSASTNASLMGVRRSTIFSRCWLGITIRVSTSLRRLSIPSSARVILRRPSNSNGLVTTATVRMSCSRAVRAITGAAPVPVPPPSPAVMNTMSAPLQRAFQGVLVFQRRFLPHLGDAAGTQPGGQLAANRHLGVSLAQLQRLQVGVDGNEVHIGQARRDHPVGGVVAAAPNPDHLDVGEAGRHLFV